MSKHIDDLSDGQCESVLMIEGEAFRCVQALDHNGWPHRNPKAEAIWGNAPAPVTVEAVAYWLGQYRARVTEHPIWVADWEAAEAFVSRFTVTEKQGVTPGGFPSGDANESEAGDE